MNAVKEVRAAHHHIEEVYTPCPVDGLDQALGLAPTKMGITAFMFGLAGLGFATWFLNYIMIENWPQNIGGKPSFAYYMNMPAFVPILFEMTVFFAAHLMVITFYMRSKIWPFRKAENPDPRTTDDKFLMEVAVDGNEDEIASLLKSTGAIEINVKEKH